MSERGPRQGEALKLYEAFEDSWRAESSYRFSKWGDVKSGEVRQSFAKAVDACIRGGFETVGEVRTTNVEELIAKINNGRRRSSGVEANGNTTFGRATFIKRAFEPQKPQE